MKNRHTFFSEKLAAVMELLQISQNRLARLAGVPQSNISKMLSGQFDPSWKTIQKIAVSLGVQVGVFVDPSIQPNDVTQRKSGRPRKNIGQTTK